ncbi:MAG: MurR/RpiR family transcriptional regulator [Lachnospiraceae bacterium]|nr:MurR/RpiR family transcriptional regulator [Lachnospiraceae bacterium]
MAGTPLEENIIVKLNNSYYHLTASEKKVADYVLGHKRQVQFMSISELADECGVAEATISRFCRRQKLHGYNAFKLALAKETAREEAGVAATAESEATAVLSAEEEEDAVIEMSRRQYAEYKAALSQTMAQIRPERIREAVDLLTAADKVFCMGQGGSMIMAQEAAHLLSTVSPRFFPVPDSHLQASAAALLTPRDVLFFFSYSGSTKDIVDIMALARERGAKSILITRFAKSPGAACADVVLQCGSNEGPLQLGTVAARMAQLFLVDILYQELCLRNPEEARVSREQIAGALADKHL